VYIALGPNSNVMIIGEPTMMATHNRRLNTTFMALVAIIALSVFTAAVAQADSGLVEVEFDTAGSVVYVGPNLTPTSPGEITSSVSSFITNGTGEIEEVQITTFNESVIGVLSGITACEDNASGAGCGTLGALFAGAGASSLHTSNATLTVDPSLSTPYTLSGELKGKLSGQFTVSTVAGVMNGGSKLKIRGTGTYACLDGAFSVVPIFVCQAGFPGYQMFPLVLNVTDTGKFTIDANPSLGLDSMEGKITVNAFVNATVFPPVIGGTVNISDAEAKLAIPGHGDSDDDDDEHDNDDEEDED